MLCQQFKSKAPRVIGQKSAWIIKSGKMAQVSSLSYSENEEKIN